MSAARNKYFRCRRLRLRRRHLCTRCGENRARPTFRTCAACAAEKMVKDAWRREKEREAAEVRRRERETRRAALVREAAKLTRIVV